MMVVWDEERCDGSEFEWPAYEDGLGLGKRKAVEYCQARMARVIIHGARGGMRNCVFIREKHRHVMLSMSTEEMQ